MASFERYSNPSRGGSLSETRFESWSVAHSKNCSEQRLLKNRLKELDRERARSLFDLSMERKCVKKDHNKLLMDRRTLVNSPHFGKSSNSRMTPINPTMSVQSGNDRIRERVSSWKIEMARRCQSASPRTLSATTTDSHIDQSTPNQLSSGKTVPQRPFSSGNMNSNTADRSVTRYQEATLSDVDEQRAISSTNHGSNSESMLPKRRVRRAERDRLVQSKVSRLRTESRVPGDFIRRAKTLRVSRSGQPQNLISLNYTDEQNDKGESHVKVKDCPMQSRRKTHQNGRWHEIENAACVETHFPPA